MGLTIKEIENAKPRDKKYKLADGAGLCLLVLPSGGKLWLWRYRFAGTEKNMTFGEYPFVTLHALKMPANFTSLRRSYWLPALIQWPNAKQGPKRSSKKAKRFSGRLTGALRRSPESGGHGGRSASRHVMWLAELFSIPARIVELDDAAAMEWQLVENSQRVDVHPYEEAQGSQSAHTKRTLVGTPDSVIERGGVAGVADCPSGPASWEKANDRSRILRAIGPTCQKRRGSRGQIPVMGTRPWMALSETMPVCAAGPRHGDSKVSTRPSGDMPAAIAADSPHGALRPHIQVSGIHRDDMKPRGESTLTCLPLRYQS